MKPTHVFGEIVTRDGGTFLGDDPAERQGARGMQSQAFLDHRLQIRHRLSVSIGEKIFTATGKFLIDFSAEL